MNFVRKNYKQTLILIAVVLVAGAGVSWLLLGRTNTYKSPTVNTVSPAPSDSTKPLTAGNKVVPTAWQTKARALGYYCPAWTAKPGEIVSSVCLPLDK